MQKISRNAYGFTLIELFTVMAVVAILFGIAYPVFISIMERARKTQAKNDLTQIVTAVNAYYTEYGKYPLVTADTTISGTTTPSNADLFYSLRAIALGANSLVNGVPAINPRAIVFIQPHDSKVSNPGRAGIDSVTTSPTFGAWFDPWGSQYRIAIDGNYNNNIDPNPYTADTGAGPSPLNSGVIAWSLGKDGAGGSGNKNSGTSADDILSWQ
jgi:prepilin-type N-terminal cleavage/methylation domain-containing protein